VVEGVVATAEVEANCLDLDGGTGREAGETKAWGQAGSRRRSRTCRRRPCIIVEVGKETWAIASASVLCVGWEWVRRGEGGVGLLLMTCVFRAVIMTFA